MPHGFKTAAIALVASVTVAGCGEGSSTLATTGEAADSVALTPQSARLEEAGATHAFTATAYLNGQPSAADIDWATDDFTVAIVGSDGVAVAQGPGQTFIIASAGQAADSAVLTVDFVSTPPGAPSTAPSTEPSP